MPRVGKSMDRKRNARSVREALVKSGRQGDCCPAMTLVLSRVKPTDRVGVMRDTLFSLSGGHRDVICVRFHKAPRGDKGEHAGATFIELNYCPWCAAKLNGDDHAE